MINVLYLANLMPEILQPFPFGAAQKGYAFLLMQGHRWGYATVALLEGILLLVLMGRVSRSR